MKNIKVWCIALLAAFAAGCGGGGGGGGGSPTMSGTAAVGFPIVGGTVNVTCAAGAAVTGIPNTSATGAWSVTLSGQTLPCAVQVSGGTINNVPNTITYQSIANAYGTVNVTPLTGVMVANLVGATSALTQPQLAAFNTAITPLSVQLDTAFSNLRTALGLPALSPTLNPITTAFNPTGGVVMDDILTALQTAMTNAGVTYAQLLASAGTSAGASINLPAGLTTTAIATAYAATSSGSGGGALTCNTGNYQAGAVHLPTTAELAAYAKTYNGKTGTYGMTGFTPDGGNATFVLSGAGALTYNGATQTVNSICKDNSIAMIYVEFGGTGAVDLFANGHMTGNLPNGTGLNSNASVTCSAGGGTFDPFTGACLGGSTAITAIANTTAQNLVVGTAISSFTPLTASGGTTPYTYSHTGILPAGLSFNASTGAVTGTPTAAYTTANLVFSVKDANNVTASTTSTVSFTVTVSGGTVLPAPTLNTPVVVSSAQIDLSWSASTGAIAYKVYRSTTAGVAINPTNIGNGTITAVSTVPTTISISGLLASTTYYFKVVAVDAAGGESPASAEMSATTTASGALAWRNTGGSRLPVVYDKTFFLNGQFLTISAPGVIRSSADGTSWATVNAGVTGDTFLALAFGNGKYVAVGVNIVGGGGQTGFIKTSTDGIAWTVAAFPSGSTCAQVTNVIFANNQFMAVCPGNFGFLMTSPDGITWTQVPSTSFWPDASAMAFGNGLYVAVGGLSSFIQTSPDGINWTIRVNSTTGGKAIGNILFAAGQFVVVAANGTILTSSDGITWASRVSGTTRNLNDVAYGNGLFAIAGSANTLTGTGTLLTSPDGVTWTLNDLTAVAPIQNLHGIAFGNTRFIAAGSLGAIITAP